MKPVAAPPRSLVLRHTAGFDEYTLRVTNSNQGDPYRETLSFTYEVNAHGDFSRYQHLGSVEIDGEDERQLLALLLARAERRKNRLPNT